MPRNDLALSAFKPAEKKDTPAAGANDQPAVAEIPAGTFFLQLRSNLRHRTRELLTQKLRQIATSFPGIEDQIKVSVDVENMDYISQKDANVIINTYILKLNWSANLPIQAPPVIENICKKGETRFFYKEENLCKNKN